MQDYEIRILNFDGTTSLTTEMPYMNVLAAVAAGRRLAGKRPYEVWQDDRCVYTSLAPPPLKPPPDQPSA